MSLKKKTVEELKQMQVSLREKLRSIQSVLDEREREKEIEELRKKADAYDKLKAEHEKRQTASASGITATSQPMQRSNQFAKPVSPPESSDEL